MSGEVIRYYSKIAGSKFIFANAFEIVFAHGFFDLKESEHQEPFFVSNNKDDLRNGKRCFDVYKSELEDLIAKGNPLIYKQGIQPAPLPRVDADRNARSEAEIAQIDALASQLPGRVTGDVNAGSPGGTAADVNSSTVDPELRKTILGQPSGIAGPGANKLAELRAKAAAHSAAANSGSGSAQ